MNEKTLKQYYKLRNQIDSYKLKKRKHETSLDVLRREVESRIESLSLCMQWLNCSHEESTIWFELESDLFRDIVQAKYFLQLVIDVMSLDATERKKEFFLSKYVKGSE